MAQEEKVARFVSKLNPPMNTRLQALRLTTFADVLDSGRPVEEEVAKPSAKESKPNSTREYPRAENPYRKRDAEGPPLRVQQKLRLPNHLFEKAKREHLCLRCLDPNHQIRDCPYNAPPNQRNEDTIPPTNGGYNQRGGNGDNGRGITIQTSSLWPTIGISIKTQGMEEIMEIAKTHPAHLKVNQTNAQMLMSTPATTRNVLKSTTCKLWKIQKKKSRT